MFELPETVTLAGQINATLAGRRIRLGNSPHKFVWYNRSEDEFGQLTQDRQVGQAHARGRWLFIPLEPGYVLLVGECGGKLLYHEPGVALPKKRHLHLAFDDDSALTATTQMWGAYELYEAGANRIATMSATCARHPSTTPSPSTTSQTSSTPQRPNKSAASRAF